VGIYSLAECYNNKNQYVGIYSLTECYNNKNQYVGIYSQAECYNNNKLSCIGEVVLPIFSVFNEFYLIVFRGLRISILM